MTEDRISRLWRLKSLVTTLLEESGAELEQNQPHGRRLVVRAKRLNLAIENFIEETQKENHG